MVFALCNVYEESYPTLLVTPNLAAQHVGSFPPHQPTSIL